MSGQPVKYLAAVFGLHMYACPVLCGAALCCDATAYKPAAGHVCTHSTKGYYAHARAKLSSCASNLLPLQRTTCRQPGWMQGAALPNINMHLPNQVRPTVLQTIDQHSQARGACGAAMEGTARPAVLLPLLLHCALHQYSNLLEPCTLKHTLPNTAAALLPISRPKQTNRTPVCTTSNSSTGRSGRQQQPCCAP